MPPRLVLGTRNKKKLHEMMELLGDTGWELADLTHYPHAPEVEETADTFVGNATLKATRLAAALSEWVVGEDSGLCVPALGGAPGVYSARYAGVHGDDAANNTKLLAAMASLTGDDRAAYYVCTAVLADPSGRVVASVEGRCHGRIAEAPWGTGGFGYDPLFWVPQYGRTFGQLPPEVKRAISHRAEALRQLRPVLEAVARGQAPTG